MTQLTTVGTNVSNKLLHTKASLDELWEEAEKLGRVSIDSHVVRGIVETTILIRDGDNRIYACGLHPEVKLSMGKAIDEGRRLLSL